jgi:DNA-binding IclR family transcriptional regulator
MLQTYGLTRYNENTIVDEQTIEEEYEQIRARGYSTDAEESTPGGYCFGAAIFSVPGKVEAAISISMPKSRMASDEDRKQRLIQALKSATEAISKKLTPQNQAGAGERFEVRVRN